MVCMSVDLVLSTLVNSERKEMTKIYHSETAFPLRQPGIIAKSDATFHDK